MCGIDGFWGARDASLLRAMTAALQHRGPDDEGTFEHDRASLGFRRLSIIDLEGGHQPMVADDGVALVYNGEVYNYRELRAELETLGHELRTRCDTEVVLHAYREWGTDCFRRFNGMWALAVFDPGTGAAGPRLVLARDHFGIKPLFWARWNDRTIFASEIKAILQDSSFPREVDDDRMYQYLAQGLFDHDDATFFAHVRTVPAASYLVVDDDGARCERYWEPVLGDDVAPDPAELRTRFVRAVERRLVADEPVGVCLSGGLDSSSICTTMAELLARRVPDARSLGEHLKTFSATFPGDPIDETRYIDTVVTATNAQSARVQPTSHDFVDELEAFVWHIEEPMVSSAPFSMWAVMRLAREQVTVTLDGQAGDELLGGYDHYPYVYLRQLLRERRWSTFAREAWRFRDVVGPLARRRLAQRRKRVDVRELLQPEFVRRARPARDARVQDDLKRRLVQDLTTYSLPPLLRYEDRMSMAHSLESRLPFLDQELVDWVTRAILRRGLAGTLPPSIARRRKKVGFTTPEFRWYRARRAVLQGILASPSFAQRPYWRAERVREAFQRACAGELEESMFFWRAVNAEIWLRLYFDARLDALDDAAWHAGFARRGDTAYAMTNPAAREVHDAARANPAKHLFLTDGTGQVLARVPVRSALVTPGDDVVAVVLDALARAPVQPRDGDCLVVGEKSVSISQGRGAPVDDIPASRAAQVLSRFVTRTPSGIGLGRPATMQLAIEEAGLPRILVAAGAAAVTRPFGRRGTFYRVAGARVNAIDGPTPGTLPPYDTWASKAPVDADGVATAIARAVRERTGRNISVAIVDVNDLGAEVLGAAGNPDAVASARRVLVDNPLGQGDEQTPFGLVRRVA
jgi:asparagine synthase (glutamine-hydrolysing)